jgi:uncharacterized membrane protein
VTLHPILILIPLGLWILSLFCDLLYLAGAEAELWLPLALYTMVGGFAGALAAAVPRFVDLVSLAQRQAKKIGLTQLPVNLVLVTLYALNILLRLGDAPHMQVAIALSMIGVSVLAVASWLGGEKAHAVI